MAFSDVVQVSPTGSSTSGEATATLSAGATAGNLLVFAVARSSAHGLPGAVWGAITGWTAGPQTQLDPAGNMAAAVWWKIAAGGETTVTTDDTNESGNWCAVIVEYEGPFTGGFDVQAENEDNTASAVTSQTSGTTATTAVAQSLAVAVFMADNGGNVTDGRAYTNDFGEDAFANSGARASVLVASKVLSATGTVETTFSTTDTGDEMYGAVLVFSGTAGGGGGDGLTPGMLRPMGIIF